MSWTPEGGAGRAAKASLRRHLAPRARQGAAAGAGRRDAGDPVQNPLDGDVFQWDDLVKGPITIANREIDDLIIVADGIPTYNFAGGGRLGYANQPCLPRR